MTYTANAKIKTEYFTPERLPIYDRFGAMVGSAVHSHTERDGTVVKLFVSGAEHPAALKVSTEENLWVGFSEPTSELKVITELFLLEFPEKSPADEVKTLVVLPTPVKFQES